MKPPLRSEERKNRGSNPTWMLGSPWLTGMVFMRLVVGSGLFILVFSGGGCGRSAAPEAPSVLAQGNITAYQIVLPEEPTAVDRYAAEQLELYLRLSTGATFPVVESTDFEPESGPGIFLGVSPQVKRALGGNPVGGLKTRSYVSKLSGGNVYLYGAGLHGNLYAVVDFLEHALEWRWFSAYESPVFSRQTTLAIDPYEHHRTPSFDTVRVHLQKGMDFPYLHGANLTFTSTLKRFAARGGNVKNLQHFVSEDVEVEALGGMGSHTLFAFVPPAPDNRYAKTFDWLEKKNYFETNPEFFSMNASGVRVPDLQLNFGNPELRKTFTANVLKLIKHEGEDITIDIGAMDVPGSFCHSPESMALEKNYGSPTGPLIDYLIELCGVLNEKHPGVRVKTLAYRRAQTQRPPILPPGKRLPDNLIIEFAPVEDNYFGDWTHPDERIQETYNHLKEWGKITADGNLRAWIYPNPWGSGYGMPVGNLQRTINNMRLMNEAGVSGIVVDLIGVNERSGLSELHNYLIMKLAMNVSGDTEKLVEEFTDAMYGKAAPVFRKYLGELEKARVTLDPLPKGVTIASRNLDEQTFPYITPANLHRWQGYFDDMEKLLPAEEKRERTNVRLARRELDFATLWRWFDLQDSYPTSYKDHNTVVERIRWANSATPEPVPEWFSYDVNRTWNSRPVRTGLIEDLNNVVLAGRHIKPFPEPLRNIPAGRIQAFLPKHSGGADEDSHFTLDADASTGLALIVDKPTLPHKIEATQDIASKRARLILDRDDIVPGQYQLHELGEITLGEDSVIALSPSWLSKLEVGQRLYEPGAGNRWKVYVSMKFEGSLYGGGEKEDRLLVDRIFLVQVGLDQFDPAHEKR